MIVLGVILLVLGYFVGISILIPIGFVILAVGLVLFLLGASGRTVGSRRYWY
jgi:hypothetical protein